MKVVMFLRYFFPHSGGVERHVFNLSKELVKKGIDVTLITEKHNNNLDDEELLEEIKILRFDYPKVRFLGLFYIWCKIFFCYLEEIRRSDIVHIHDVFIWYLPFRLLFFRKPVYVTFHGYPSFPLNKKVIFYQKIAEKLTKGNICVGRFIKKWFLTKPTILTYGGVDTSLFYPLSNNESLIYSAVFLGRLDEQTGFLKFLEAVDKLNKKGFEFNLLVLGEGEYKNKMIDSKVKYLGSVEDPSSFVRKSGFVFASGYLSMLEAFASRKLVFVTFGDSLKKDYLKMTPFSDWIVVREDSEKLADAIAYYLTHPREVEEKIGFAYQWSKRQTWKILSEKYLKLWNV